MSSCCAGLNSIDARQSIIKDDICFEFECLSILCLSSVQDCIPSTQDISIITSTKHKYLCLLRKLIQRLILFSQVLESRPTQILICCTRTRTWYEYSYYSEYHRSIEELVPLSNGVASTVYDTVL